jgi:seryl-tRNA synthetase
MESNSAAMESLLQELRERKREEKKLVAALDSNYEKIKELEKQLEEQINEIKSYVPSHRPPALSDLRFVARENGKDLYRLKTSSRATTLHHQSQAKWIYRALGIAVEVWSGAIAILRLTGRRFQTLPSGTGPLH